MLDATDWQGRAERLDAEHEAASVGEVAERLGYPEDRERWGEEHWERVLRGVQGQLATETEERWRDVVMERAGDTTAQMQRGDAVINLAHAEKRHSPTGMEWGYSGSGPADLALNVLLAFGFDPDEVDKRYQQFKAEVIAELPREGGRLTREMVEAWWTGTDVDVGGGDTEDAPGADTATAAGSVAVAVADEENDGDEEEATPADEAESSESGAEPDEEESEGEGS